jgi:hypothetical protein
VAVIALANGGSNPLIIGLSGGIGLCISDFAFYYVVSKGTHVIDKHWGGITEFIKKWMKIVPDWAVYTFVFFYSAFAPIPNDIMLATLAIGKYSFKKVMPYLFAGDILLVILMAYLSR